MCPMPAWKWTFGPRSSGARREPPLAAHGELVIPDSSRLSAAQRAVLALIRAYKILLSPMFAGSCRFLPSCSEYAAEAVATLGVFRGSLAAARRLSRCHPFGSHGFDPVPRPRRQSQS